MRTGAWCVLLLVACDAGPPVQRPASPASQASSLPPSDQPDWPPPPKPRPASLEGSSAILNYAGHTYAVVRVRAWEIECSNLGGAHWTFDIDGLGPAYALHGGGHGIFGGTTIPIVSPKGIPYGPGDPSRYYVAEISTMPLVDLPPGGDCVEEPGAFNGTVISIGAARDLTGAREALAAIPLHGFEPELRIDRPDRAQLIRPKPRDGFER